jgi:hypothetical protein
VDGPGNEEDDRVNSEVEAYPLEGAGSAGVDWPLD